MIPRVVCAVGVLEGAILPGVVADGCGGFDLAGRRGFGEEGIWGDEPRCEESKCEELRCEEWTCEEVKGVAVWVSMEVCALGCVGGR